MRLPPGAGDLAARALRAYARGLLRLERLVDGFMEEALPILLDDEGLRRFRDRVWLQTGTAAPGRPLFAWEEAWYRRDLPQPPARILVGAAGRGREVKWLVDRGYSVSAFEPVQQFLSDLKSAGAEVVTAASCEDLVSGRAPLIVAGAPFDALILGWGSLGLIRGNRSQRAFLTMARELVPRGPVLLSYLGSAPGSGGTRNVGRALARALGLSGRTSGERLYSHLGFVHCFGTAELAALAAMTGNAFGHPPAAVGDYPHVTLVPASELSQSDRRQAREQSSQGENHVVPGLPRSTPPIEIATARAPGVTKARKTLG